jgi:probable addiction module antidote protein
MRRINMKTATKTEKKKITFKKWDPAKYIETKEDVIALLKVVLEENDPDFLLRIIGYIARSKGMTQIARELKLDRKGLYKSLAPDGNPSFKTVFKLLDILGLRIKLEKKDDK